jgi:hypothetical protein
MVESVTARFSRRKLLKTGLVGALIVGTSGGLLALQKPRARPLPAQGLRVLDAEEFAILAAVADRLCPALGAGAPGASALDVALQADRLFDHAPKDAQTGIKTVLRVFDNALAGALFGERVRSFSELSAEQQDRELAHWRDSRIGFRRTVFHALNTLVGSIYFGDERTWPRIGYPGPPSLGALRAAYAENLVDLHALRANKPFDGGLPPAQGK